MLSFYRESDKAKFNVEDYSEFHCIIDICCYIDNRNSTESIAFKLKSTQKVNQDSNESQKSNDSLRVSVPVPRKKWEKPNWKNKKSKTNVNAGATTSKVTNDNKSTKKPGDKFADFMAKIANMCNEFAKN